MATRQQNILDAAQRRRQNAIASGNTTVKQLEDTNVQNQRKKQQAPQLPVNQSTATVAANVKSPFSITNSVLPATQPVKTGGAFVDPVSTSTAPMVNDSNFQKSGFFKNKSTGGYTNAQGVAIDPMTGKPFVETKPEVPATYAEIGAANTQAEYDANVVAADELGLTDTYTSQTQQYEDIIRGQREQKALQERQLELQKTQVGEQTSEARNAIEGQVEAASGLVGSREGVVSQSNLSAYDRLKEASGTRISRLQRDQDMAIAGIEQAKSDLARAEREGNTELASKYRKQLLAAEDAARQTETDYVNALTMASEEERNVQAQKNANLTTFTGLVDQGVELQPDQIIGFAQSLNVPFETAYAYYTGAQNIRDDKNLSLEEKQIANAQNLQNLNDQITGRDIEAVKKAEIYNQMVASGDYTQEQLQVISGTLGIPDRYNASYQAQLAYDTANAAIKNYEAKYLGQPPPSGSVERLDYDIKKAELAKAEYELNESYGNPSGVIDISTAETVFQIPGKSKWHSGPNEWECGEAYNRITDGGDVGDDYSTKLALTKGADGQPRRDNPQVGNGLVLPLTAKDQPLDTGHIETILSVSPSGQIQTVSWNRDGNGTQTLETYTIDDLNEKYGQNWGFTDSHLLPEYAKSLSAVQGSGEYGTDQYLSNALAGSAGGSKVDVTSNQGLLKSFQAVNQIEMVMNSLGMGKDVKLDANGQPLDESIDMSPLTGWLKSKNPWDADAQETKAILQGTVPIIARGIFGEVGVLTDSDIALYQQVLPNLTQTSDVRKLVTAALLKTVKQGMYDRLNLLANTGYDVSGLYPSYEAISKKVSGLESELGINANGSMGQPEEDPDSALYQSFSNYDDPDYLEAQQGWSNPASVGGRLTQ